MINWLVSSYSEGKMAKISILIVEDDPDILELLAYNFRAGGYDVRTCETGTEAIDMAGERPPDLVLLDLMIPEVDGLEVCRRLKTNPAMKNIPVIMLTAKGDEVDRIVGLELGADDYVVKPFSPRELMLRARAVLRRATAEPAAETLWQAEGLRVDFEAHKVTVDGEEVFLTATEFKLLEELIRHRGKVQTRDQLLEKAWGYQFEGYARTVDTHVRRLRQKLGDYSHWVETVRGVGYRLQG
jgi:two-component system phosphate regulon response regulator PhoB